MKTFKSLFLAICFMFGFVVIMYLDGGAQSDTGYENTQLVQTVQTGLSVVTSLNGDKDIITGVPDSALSSIIVSIFALIIRFIEKRRLIYKHKKELENLTEIHNEQVKEFKSTLNVLKK